VFGLPPLRPITPGESALRAFAHAHAAMALSYEEVGATRTGPMPSGFVVDEDQIAVGSGPEVFARARDAVRSWAMFDLPWLSMPDRTPPEVGNTVVFASWQLGLWAFNACRVVYVVDEPDEAGFAYGTLRDHGLSGEERFLVRRDPHTDAVTFSIVKFSRIVSPVVRLVRPAVRALQKRFSREACQAVRAAMEAR
jgi:uncharacterized protein (UPF0548 family)